MNQLKIFKISFLMFFISINLIFSQESKSISKRVENSTTYQYYVDVKGVETKEICKKIENAIAAKKNVVSFRTVGFPSKYFVLKSNAPISEDQLRGWITENNLVLSFYGQSESTLEALISNKRKLNN